MIKELADLLIAAGCRPPLMVPDKFQAGRFVFKGVIPDNSTDPDSLLDAANRSEAFNNLFGVAATPSGVIHIESMRFMIETGAETPAVLHDVLQEVCLRVQRGSDVKLYDLAPYASTYDVFGTDEETQKTMFHRQKLIKLPDPIIVDVESDQMGIVTPTAVDAAADIPCILEIGGAFYPNTQLRQQRKCLTKDKTGPSPGEYRVQTVGAIFDR